MFAKALSMSRSEVVLLLLEVRPWRRGCERGAVALRPALPPSLYLARATCQLQGQGKEIPIPLMYITEMVSI